MGIQRLQGLKGIRLSDLSKKDRLNWRRENEQLLVAHDYDAEFERSLYTTQLYDRTFGPDAGKGMTDEEKEERLTDVLVNEAWERNFSPYKTDENGVVYEVPGKGIPKDMYEKYSKMTSQGKLELLKSDWQTPAEFEENFEDNSIIGNRPIPSLIKTIFGNGSGVNTYLDLTDPVNLFGKGAEKGIKRNINAGILDKIYVRDMDRQTSKLKEEVSETRKKLEEVPEDQIEEAFQSVITPSGNNGGGVPYMKAFYNEGGESAESELDDFSINNKRDYIAKFMVYGKALGSEQASAALNIEAQRYINDHQKWYTVAGLLATDIGQSTLSYTFDKVNSVRMLALAGVDAVADKVTVFRTADGKIVPTDKVQGDEKNGYVCDGVQVMPVKMSRTALDWNGYDSDGNKRSAPFNQQYWSDVEQFGTMDWEEQEKYKKIGVSPHKVVWAPGEEGSIIYESAKMTSFALADAGTMLIPGGFGAVSKYTGVAADVARGVGNISKANRLSKISATSGKTAEMMEKTFPTIAAMGIANAYGRGVNGEMVQGNLTALAEDTYNKANAELRERYKKDPKFREEMENRVNTKAAKIVRAALNLKEGEVFDESKYNKEALKELTDYAKTQALTDVNNEVVQEFVESKQNTPEYQQKVADAYNTAAKAALITAGTTGIKYGIVNNWGFRSFWFKNPVQRAQKMAQETYASVREVVTKDGTKRLEGTNKFATMKDKFKQVGKAAGKQVWGGSWTNFTDEMQSWAGKNYSEKMYEAYLEGRFDSDSTSTLSQIINEASAVVYGITSAVEGANKALSEGSTYRAGLVGGLGSLTSIGPNIPSLTSGQFRSSWAKAKSPMEKINLIASNGVLADYYAAKHAEANANHNIQHINELMDKFGDFSVVKDALKIQLASSNLTNMEDATTMKVLQAVNALEMLSDFQKTEGLTDEERQNLADNAVLFEKSSVMTKAMELLNLVQDESKPLSEEHTKELLDEYYVANPSVVRNEANDQNALQMIRDNAKIFSKAMQSSAEVDKKLDEVESTTKKKISNVVRYELKKMAALSDHWKQRFEELENSLGVVSTDIDEVSEDTDVRSYGDNANIKRAAKGVEARIKSLDKKQTEADNKIATKEKEIEDLKEKIDKESKSDTANLETVMSLCEELEKKKDELEAAKLSKRYYSNLQTRLFNLHKELSQERTEEEVISADDIMRLNPVDRARMLNPENREHYSKKQQVEIDKCLNDLTKTNPTANATVRDIATLYERYKANEKAMATVTESPYAAAVQYESMHDANEMGSADIAVTKVCEWMDNLINKIAAFTEATDKDKADVIYKNLRVVTSSILQHYFDNFDTSSLDSAIGETNKAALIQRALEWSKFVSDMKNAVETMGTDLTTAEGKATWDLIRNTIEECDSVEQATSLLEAIVDGKEIPGLSKEFADKLLSTLEGMGRQRDATVVNKRKERKLAEEASEKEGSEKTEDKEKSNEKKDEKEDKKDDGISKEDIDTLDKNPKPKGPDDDSGSGGSTIIEDDSNTDKTKTDKTKKDDTDVDPVEGISLDNEAKLLEDDTKKNIEIVDVDEMPLEEDMDDIYEIGMDETIEEDEDLESIEPKLLVGHLSVYDRNVLTSERVATKVVPKEPKSALALTISWANKMNIDLQGIVDNEVGKIRDLDKDVKLMVTHPQNSRHSEMKDIPLYVVEYTDDIRNIHDDTRGGVITAQDGKQYLIIGTMTFDGKSESARKYHNAVKEKIRRRAWMSTFKDNSDAEFFVDTVFHTKIAIHDGGRLVQQDVNETKIEDRSVLDLLNDPDRNPEGLTIPDLKWGIQKNLRFATVNASGRNRTLKPLDPMANNGSIFLLVQAGNGDYIPAKVLSRYYQNLSEGSKLKRTINGLAIQLLSSYYSDRLKAIKQLVQLLAFDKQNNILIGDPNHQTVSVIKDGVTIASFNLLRGDVNLSSMIEAINSMNPRINISLSTLSNPTLIEEYAKEGLLDINLSKLYTVGSSFKVFPCDISTGEPILTTTLPTSSTGKFKEAASLTGSAVYYDMIYRVVRDSNGNRTIRDQRNNIVTDPRTLAQVEWNLLLNTTPESLTEGHYDYWVRNNDPNNPLVVRRPVRGRENVVEQLSKEVALDIIEKVKRKAADEAKKKAAEEELKKINAEIKKTTTSNLNTLTPEQIAQQERGNFSSKNDSKPTQSTQTDAPTQSDANKGLNNTKGVTAEMVSSVNDVLFSDFADRLLEVAEKKGITNAEDMEVSDLAKEFNALGIEMSFDSSDPASIEKWIEGLEKCP